MTFSPFRIDVSDEVLDDLRARLARSRFTARSGDQPWQAGTDPDYLRHLLSYWLDGSTGVPGKSNSTHCRITRPRSAAGACTSFAYPGCVRQARPRRCR